MKDEEDYVYMGKRMEWGQEHPFGLGISERRQHIYTIGQTGTGKSTLLHNLIMQDIEAGRGVGLIDPHGDLAHEILEHIPPWRTNDVVYFDPSSRKPASLSLFRSGTNDWHLATSG